jgi:hypothetical protein
MQETRRSKVKEFFRDNPTLVLTLMYVDLTGIGILYSFVFYGQFEINIFDFAEIGDFLLAAFKAPAVTFFVLLVQVLVVVLFTLIVRPLLARARRELPTLLAQGILPIAIELLTFGLIQGVYTTREDRRMSLSSAMLFYLIGATAPARSSRSHHRDCINSTTFSAFASGCYEARRTSADDGPI